MSRVPVARRGGDDSGIVPLRGPRDAGQDQETGQWRARGARSRQAGGAGSDKEGHAMKTPDEIERGLANFTGTDQWHRYLGGLLLTDGVKWLADSAECFWLLDVIASYQLRCVRDPMLHDLQFWTVVVDLEKKSARVICERDTDDVFLTQD